MPWNRYKSKLDYRDAVQNTWLYLMSQWWPHLQWILACSFEDVDIALFSAGGSISKKFAHVASDAGATVRLSC